MQFGIFFEMSTPSPFGGDTEKTVYDHALEQARLADELGFDSRLGGGAPFPGGVLALLGA